MTAGITPVERLLSELIALPSINPSFASDPRDPRLGERRMAEFLAATAAAQGLAVELQEVLPDRPNLLVRLQPPGPIRQRVVLAPHMDTVGVTSAQQLQPVRRQGRVYGRGACDTKGSLAAMFTALTGVARSGRRPSDTEIILDALMDEEDGQAGSRSLAQRAFRADLAIVGEPTELRVVTAHKGDLWLQLETRGKSAHGARPELGRNAVHEMARIVHLLETEYARLLRRRRHPLLGHATINVGSICGGVQPNIVPDRCAMVADRRTLPGESEAGVRREIQALLRQHGLKAHIHDTRAGPCPALETDADQPLVRAFLDCTGQRGLCGVDYFCDAAVLAQAGTPCVVFGPGDIAQAHTADEWISCRQLNAAVDRLDAFLRSLP